MRKLSANQKSFSINIKWVYVTLTLILFVQICRHFLNVSKINGFHRFSLIRRPLPNFFFFLIFGAYLSRTRLIRSFFFGFLSLDFFSVNMETNLKSDTAHSNSSISSHRSQPETPEYADEKKETFSLDVEQAEYNGSEEEPKRKRYPALVLAKLKQSYL